MLLSIGEGASIQLSSYPAIQPASRESVLRRSDNQSGSMFSCVDLEERLQVKHRPRLIKASVDDALASLDADVARLHGSAGLLTLGADKGSAPKPWATELRAVNVALHITNHDPVTKTGKRQRSSDDGRWSMISRRDILGMRSRSF